MEQWVQFKEYDVKVGENGTVLLATNKKHTKTLHTYRKYKGDHAYTICCTKLSTLKAHYHKGIYKFF